MNPSLTSSSGSGQNEPFRIERLQKVSKIYSIQVENSTDLNQNEIISLHDHKGQLTVIWNNEPNEEQKIIIKQIWELQNEDGENVVHETEE